jgi:hypothetical protein
VAGRWPVMITLDPIQFFALRKSAFGPVDVSGWSGTGKSSLANAIASQAAGAGKSCLLVGTSDVLDRPLSYGVIREIHRVLADRAQLSHPAASSSGPPSPRPRQANPIQARVRSNPAAARVAARMLQKARELENGHNLTPAEVEESIVTERALAAGAANSLSLAMQDASRIADVLWTGNARAGRTFKDVDEVVSGRSVEVPPNDEALTLILADDQKYDGALAKIVSSQQEAKEDRAVSNAVGALLRPRSSDRTLSEYHKHASFMARTIGGAIALIKRHGNFKAAVTAGGGNDAAKAIEYFVRMRPDQGLGAAVKTFEAALQDYRHDTALLEPLLAEHGSKALASFGTPTAARDGLPLQDIGSLVQKLREARYAARHLPSHLGALRGALSRSLFERIMSAPIEDATDILGSVGTPDPRSKAAAELRQLRDLFASTGFGDLFEAPKDLVDQIGEASTAPEKIEPQPLGQSYSPEVLDLLLELTSVIERIPELEWPASVKRARTAKEIAGAIESLGRFDVVVIDDVASYPPGLISDIQRSGSTVHRVGSAQQDNAIALEIPHRQADAAIAAAASRRPGRWLGAPESFGVLVRADPALNVGELSAAADGLVSELRRNGCSAALSSAAQSADVIVAAMDELRDADLAAIAEKACRGIVVLCRADGRSPASQTSAAQTADVKSAQSLGWNISRSTIEGTVIEKGGRLAALIGEAIAVSPWDETVADVSRRLEALGWHPIVSWNGTERSSRDLEDLLASHSVSATPSPFRKIAEDFDLRSPPLPPGGGTTSHDSHHAAAAEPVVTASGELLQDDQAAPDAAPSHAEFGGDHQPHAVLSEKTETHAGEYPSGTPDDTQPDPLRDERGLDGGDQMVEPAAIDEPASGDAAAGADDPQPESQEAEESITLPSRAPSGTPAVFRDRRGTRRAAAPRDGAEPRCEGRAAPIRQSEAKLRLTIDEIRKRAHLAGVLLRPEGFPEEIDIDGFSVQAFDQSRYGDIDLDWSPELLAGELRFKDTAHGLEWIRSARPFHVFAAMPGEPDLMTASAAALGTDCTIVCREEDMSAIEAVTTEAGSPALRRFVGFQGVPPGWVVLAGYSPVRALAAPPEWLKPLDPGAEISISMSGGFKIRHAVYAQGEPPLIRIEGMPSNCEVFIDRETAEKQDDGSWTAPGWDAPGSHLIDIVPGPSQSYDVMADPAFGAGWEPWKAHDSLAVPLAGVAAVCGAMVFCPDGRMVLATEAASSVTALGAEQQVKALSLRRDAPAAIAALLFEPLFVIISSGGRRANSKILVLNFRTAQPERRPAQYDRRWASTVRDLAARRIPVRPQTPAADATWRSATRQARRWRRGK